tara:strand:+ start:911 stop:1135 length:225 start_codon:yes stop_codon:yes gene_type:complete
MSETVSVSTTQRSNYQLVVNCGNAMDRRWAVTESIIAGSGIPVTVEVSDSDGETLEWSMQKRILQHQHTRETRP